MRAIVIASTGLNPALFDLAEGLDYDIAPGNDSFRPASILAEFAGRLCYKSWKRPNPKTATNRGYINNLLDHKHFSVLEHGTVSFYFDGISRNLTHELVRHRHFSYSQVSQRYCNDSKAATLTPEAVEGLLDDGLDAELADHISDAKELYQTIIAKLKAKGVDGKKAQQAARFILPGNTETAIVVSGNHRSWREFVDKRYSEFADPEIRQLAGLVLDQLKALEPNIYADFAEKEF